MQRGKGMEGEGRENDWIDGIDHSPLRDKVRSGQLRQPNFCLRPERFGLRVHFQRSL